MLALGGFFLMMSVLTRESVPAERGLDQTVFVVHTADGTDTGGSLRELTADWELRVGEGGEGTRIPAANIVGARRPGAALPPMPAGEHLILANGDRLPVDRVRLDGEKLFGRCTDADGTDISLPLGSVAIWWKTAPDGVAAPDQLLRRLLSGLRRRDAVYLRNGDVVEGTIESWTDMKLSLEADGKRVSIDLGRVAAVAIGSEPASGLRPKGLYGCLTLDSGARLTVASAECHDGQVLTCRAAFGATLRLPLENIVAIDWLGGRAVYLSDLKPAGFDEPLPYLGPDSVRWPPVKDGSVAERDLRLGGSTYAKGIGMHSSGRLRYALGGAYRVLEATVGLDDNTGRQGCVRIRVLGDGRALPTGIGEELTAKNGPVKLQVNIRGVRELTLEVDVGRNGNVQGHVDWADARVIK